MARSNLQRKDGLVFTSLESCSSRVPSADGVSVYMRQPSNQMSVSHQKHTASPIMWLFNKGYLLPMVSDILTSDHISVNAVQEGIHNSLAMLLSCFLMDCAVW